MNTSKYTLREFLTHQNMDQLIIPEIQRDYVWESQNVIRLLKSLNEDALKQTQIDNDELEQLSPELKEITLKGLQQNRKFTNIGFIYAYYDSGYLNKYFLIDGQQRLTTVFLLLLALSLESDKNNFRKSYFFNKVPKINYKVREASQEFLRNFICDILDNKNIFNIKNSFWYLSEYESDITIQSIINNYETINDFTKEEHCALDFSYIENNVEFWYFDTNKSSQGEELYIYMNSRGETVQENEKIKASLLEVLSDNEKSKWGKKWEDWQDFFWKNRNHNDNADKGFNLFLKWIKIINYTINSHDIPLLDKENFVKNTMSSTIISAEFLTLLDIKNYIESLKIIFSLDISYFNKKWLYGEMDLADLIRFLPVLMFVKEYSNANIDHIRRYARFFYNIPRFPYIRRNPDTFCVHAINITSDFLSDGHMDVTGLINYVDNENYERILNDEEVYKLNLYMNPPANVIREDLENEIWKAEDFSLFLGQIDFLFYCMNIKMTREKVNSFSLKTFKNLASYIIQLFDDNFSPDDLFRRALLTKGDYSLKDGNTPKLGGERWTFIHTIEKWRSITKNSSKKYLKKLLLHYSKLILKNNSDRNTTLNHIIDNYVKPDDENEQWIYYFITEPKVLDFCCHKNICWLDSNPNSIYLLRETRATDGSFILLSEFLEE